jgi:hypothetical protein
MDGLRDSVPRPLYGRASHLPYLALLRWSRNFVPKSLVVEGGANLMKWAKLKKRVVGERDICLVLLHAN